MSIVAKQSPISATAEVLYIIILCYVFNVLPSSIINDGDDDIDDETGYEGLAKYVTEDKLY